LTCILTHLPVSNGTWEAALGQIDTPEMAELGMHFGQFQELDAGAQKSSGKSHVNFKA